MQNSTFLENRCRAAQYGVAFFVLKIKMNIYTLLLKNNSSNAYFHFDKLADYGNDLFYEINLTITGLPSGEYSYCLFYNERDDVEYDFKNDMLQTLLKTGDGNIRLELLRPETGVLKIEGTTANFIYRQNKHNFIYR